MIDTSVDHRPLQLEKILSGLKTKFDENFLAALPYASLAQQHEVRVRRFGIARDYMAESADKEHQKALAIKLDEVFGDFVCALYLAYSGMDVPARMLIRRAVELTVVLISCWDRPAEYWAWQTHDEDVSFSKIHQYLLSSGYRTFLEKEGGTNTLALAPCLSRLQLTYSQLSNVVHPKPYNFETAAASPFVFSKIELEETLELIKNGQSDLLLLLGLRFPDLDSIFDSKAPLTEIVDEGSVQ